MQDIHGAYLLSQSFQRAQPEGLREHCDLHFGDTSCSCYFNCGLVAYSQGKEWILGQKEDSFLLSFQSLIPDTALNHHIAWKIHYNAQACQPGDKATGMKINVTYLSMSSFSVHCPSFCLSFLSFLLLSSPGNLENFYSNLKLMRVLHNSHLGAKYQSQAYVTLQERLMLSFSPPAQTHRKRAWKAAKLASHTHSWEAAP